MCTLILQSLIFLKSVYLITNSTGRGRHKVTVAIVIFLLIVVMTPLTFLTKAEVLRASLSVRDGEILDLSCRVPVYVSISKVDKLELLFESLTTSGASGSLALVTSDSKLHSSKLRPQASVKGSITNDLKNTFLQVSMPFSQSDYGNYKCATFYEENLRTTTASTEMIVDIKSERSQMSSNFNVKVVPAYELNFTWTQDNVADVTEYSIKRAIVGEVGVDSQTTVYAKYENPSTVYQSNTSLLRNFTTTLKPVYDSFEASNILLLVVEKENGKPVSRFIADVSDSYNSATVVAFVSQSSPPDNSVYKHDDHYTTEPTTIDIAPSERILYVGIIIALATVLVISLFITLFVISCMKITCSKVCKSAGHYPCCGVMVHGSDPNTGNSPPIPLLEVEKGLNNTCCHSNREQCKTEEDKSMMPREAILQDDKHEPLTFSKVGILRTRGNVEIRSDLPAEKDTGTIDLQHPLPCSEGKYARTQSENDPRAETESTREERIERENSQPATQEEVQGSDHEIDHSKTPF